MKSLVLSITFPVLFFLGFTFFRSTPDILKPLKAVIDESKGTISIFRPGTKEPVLVQHARSGFRPYIHPIVAPDGKGLLTEYSPSHHKHQTGLYWGFTRVNGRDYFHNPQADYWKKIALTLVKGSGEEVKWQTVYDLLDEQGTAILRETQNWTMKEENGRYYIDLEWNGEALSEITIGKYDYGGLFLRMPWKQGIKGEVVNAARQRNEKAEGQPAMWVDVGMQVEGRSDLAHIAIFDHPENKGYPQQWRVDNQLGIGPVRARSGDWKIPKGETETIKHQLVVYTGELNNVAVTKEWENFIGQQSLYSTTKLWEIAQREGREAKFLTPEEAVKHMTLGADYQVNVWASEPVMKQPMAFCWDDRGRMWVAENLDYESRGGGFSNDGNSRIIILEDTNRDGVADKKKIFLEGIPFPAAIAVGFDGVFVGAPPNLLFVPDKNGDDKADVDGIEVRLTGWGIRDRHETLNSFHWGPDGWLYGLQGFATPSKVRKPVGKGKLYKHKEAFPEDLLKGEGTDINGGVWRYHPTKDRFEVVAHGFSNPWGIDFDANGQLLISACVIPHLWHVIPGGIYQRQGGQHFNPYIYNDIKTITDHSHRSAHGGARVYLSDAFPAAQYGRIFMANIHEHAVLSDVLHRKGSGFTASHGEDFMLANNAQFVGFSMEIGPEGGLYVLDWHDGDICGKEVLNKETGRIFRITPRQSLATNWEGRYADLNSFTDEQLVTLQKNKSEWHARRARGILQKRAVKKRLDEKIYQQLQQMLASESNRGWRLNALWTLHATGGITPTQLTQLLNEKDEYLRAWAIQLLCEDSQPPSDALARFSTLAKDDPSPVVRLYLASALQRVGKAAAWNLVAGLLKHPEDSSDHNLPKLIWTGMEPLVKDDPEKALQFASTSALPSVAQWTARRLVDGEKMDLLVTSLGKKPRTLNSMLLGMRDGMEGRYDMTAPAAWKTIYPQLVKGDKQTAALAASIDRQFGNTAAARNYLATVKNKNASAAQRRTALQEMSNRQRPELIKEFPGLLNDPVLRIDVIRAIAAYDHEPLAKMLIDQYAHFTAAEKLQAIQTMSSRPKYGWQLSQALSKNIVPKADVPAYAARQLLRVVGSGFIEIWGPIEQSKIDEKAYLKYKKLLTDQAISKANPIKGRTVFKSTCGPCHKMYGEGGIIGPDLTGSNRTNVEYILSNVMDPSGEIQDDYKMVVITTRDGRNYAGNIASENERQLVMRVVGQDAVVINKSNIQSRETTEVSMMPPGLFNNLSDPDVLALVAFLRSMDQTGKAQAKK